MGELTEAEAWRICIVLDEVGKYERKKAKQANKTSSPYVSPSAGFETEWTFGEEEG